MYFTQWATKRLAIKRLTRMLFRADAKSDFAFFERGVCKSVRLYADGLYRGAQRVRNWRMRLGGWIFDQNHHTGVIWPKVIAGAVSLYSCNSECLPKLTAQPFAPGISAHHMHRDCFPGKWLEQIGDHLDLCCSQRWRHLHLLRHALLLLSYALRELGGLLVLCSELSFCFLGLSFMFSELDLEGSVGLARFLRFLIGDSCVVEGLRAYLICGRCIKPSLGNLDIGRGFICREVSVLYVGHDVAIMNCANASGKAEDCRRDNGDFTSEIKLGSLSESNCTVFV